MDTTAAAELAVGMSGHGVDSVSFWDQDASSEDEDQPQPLPQRQQPAAAMEQEPASSTSCPVPWSNLNPPPSPFKRARLAVPHIPAANQTHILSHVDRHGYGGNEHLHRPVGSQAHGGYGRTDQFGSHARPHIPVTWSENHGHMPSHVEQSAGSYVYGENNYLHYPSGSRARVGSNQNPHPDLSGSQNHGGKPILGDQCQPGIVGRAGFGPFGGHACGDRPAVSHHPAGVPIHNTHTYEQPQDDPVSGGSRSQVGYGAVNGVVSIPGLQFSGRDGYGNCGAGSPGLEAQGSGNHDMNGAGLKVSTHDQYGCNNVGTLQKQGSLKGSNSFTGELSTVVEEASSTGRGSSTLAKGKNSGSIFFKTKLCLKFKAGICPYDSTCNFAHGMEDLRKPPPGWEGMIAAQEPERTLPGFRDHQIHVVVESTRSESAGDMQRFHTSRSCRRYYTEDGCPYGDRCIFMHDDHMSQTRALRESNAISLGPSSSTSYGSAVGDRQSSWRNKVCNKWETTGQCPFGQKCHFIHGSPDGQVMASHMRHGGGVLACPPFQKQGSKVSPKWKGPADEISTIYGDWIEDDEWENLNRNMGSIEGRLDLTCPDHKKEKMNLQQINVEDFAQQDSVYNNVGQEKEN